jgi:response regulator RpfG family c-di-GMP phosphodiesterase
MSKDYNSSIICVDDERAILESYKEVLAYEADSLDDLIDCLDDELNEDESSDDNRSNDEFDIVLANSGEEAIEIVKSEFAKGNRFAAGFFDMRMPPGIDGYETISKIREIDPGVICAVVTGYTDRNVTKIRKLFSTEHQDELLYFQKPFSSTELQQTAINMVTSWNRKRKEEVNVQIIRKNASRLQEMFGDLQDSFAQKSSLIRDLYEVMDEMLGNRDHYTFEHALRVAEISKRVGILLGISDEDLEFLELGCLVHDSGKIAIPDDVLLKPGRFDKLDRRIMNCHPLVGARMFACRDHDDRVTEIILHHHERLDGNGYPAGLKGEEISLLVRIVSVADTYEALIARRPYKNPISRERAYGILAEEVENGALDARVVEALIVATKTWDPLDITRDYTADYMKDLEMFRQMTYFREPLSDFYNYRYLLFLDNANFLEQPLGYYHLIVVDFNNLREFNKRVGYIKADEILDSIGSDFYKMADVYNKSGKDEHFYMVVRKGGDFLIYSQYSEEKSKMFYEQINNYLKEYDDKYGLVSRLNLERFNASVSIEKSLDKIMA